MDGPGPTAGISSCKNIGTCNFMKNVRKAVLPAPLPSFDAPGNDIVTILEGSFDGIRSRGA